MAQGYYLYGVVDASGKKNWGGLGFNKRKVSTIPFRNIAAAVTPGLSEAVAATAENCLIHERVLNNVIQTETILPFEFGTVACDIEAVNNLLRGNYTRFRRALVKLKGTVEVNVTTLWHDMEFIFEEVVRTHPIIATYNHEIMTKPYEQTYQDLLKIRQLAAEVLEVKKYREGGKIYRALKRNAGGGRVTYSARAAGNSVIFTGAFLVRRRTYSHFERSMQALMRRYDGRIDFKYAGPLPPYHFVNTRITV